MLEVDSRAQAACACRIYCMNFVPIDSVASSASQIKDELPPQPFRRRALADSSAVRRPSPSRATASRSIPVEIAFLSAHGVPEQVLQFAAATARRQGVCADEALLAEGLVSRGCLLSGAGEASQRRLHRQSCRRRRVRRCDGRMRLRAGSGPVERVSLAVRAERQRRLSIDERAACGKRPAALRDHHPNAVLGGGAPRRSRQRRAQRGLSRRARRSGTYARAAACGADRWDCCSSR